MGFMTIQTSHLIDQGPVNPIFVKYFIHQGAVAPPTKLIPCFLCFKRGRRIRRFMALVTDFVGNRWMHIVKQDSSPIRAMGIMTGSAIRLSHRIIHVLLYEAGLICLMTAGAENHRIVFQEVVCFARAMWFMTVDASPLHRRMPEFYFRNGTRHTLMTAEAEFAPRFKEGELIIRGVRVVAFNTIAFGYNFMTAPWILRRNAFMTLQADLIRIFFQ
jgi:hypothetical protein